MGRRIFCIGITPVLVFQVLGYQRRECEMDFSSSDPRSHRSKPTAPLYSVVVLLVSVTVTILYDRMDFSLTP